MISFYVCFRSFTLSLRGPQGSNEFLREMVADEFFTEGGSAWVHVQLHQKNAVPVGKYKVSRTTLGHVTTPKTEVDLVVHSLSSKLRQLTQVNLTKVEKSTQHLLVRDWVAFCLY